jgi:hypothetical protein
MAEVRLRADLEESKAEITRSKQRMSPDVPTVSEDHSLISVVPKWSGPRHQCLWKNLCPA